MRKPMIVTMLIMLALFLPHTTAASEGGVDVNPSSDEPFTVIKRDSPSIDNEQWTLSIEMTQEAYDNGTTFELITQICTNDGVCDPPVVMDADVTERIHSISVTPPSDHTYVNWRVKALDKDGNKTNYPQGDWFKTWSSCWYNDGAWGGADSSADGCLKSDESTPGFATLVTISAISMAALMATRRINHQK